MVGVWCGAVPLGLIDAGLVFVTFGGGGGRRPFLNGDLVMEDFLGYEQCDDCWLPDTELDQELSDARWMEDEDDGDDGADGQPDEMTEWLDYDPDC